ncbi:MAG: methyltransferase domain-containing protein [Burkholderiales bacterium]
MSFVRSLARAAVALALVLPAATVIAADATYTPQVGQEGKDVIWVPTPENLIAKMLDMAKVTPNDIVFDLGSGDGRTVIAAAKRGAKATGIEFNPDMASLSKLNAEKAGVSANATFINGDIFVTDFSKATVVTMYLLPSLNVKLRPTILNMKPGTRVVSHAFTMDDWKADETASVEGRTAYFWIVPAKVAGTWTWQANNQNYEVTLAQKYQELTGTAMIGGKPAKLTSAKINGDQITLTVDEGGAVREFTGRVSGSAIDGMAKAGGSAAKWAASGKLAKS